MPSVAATLTAISFALSSVVDAHFSLDSPPPIGFDEGKEPTGPCGGFTPDFSKNNVTDFHVGGDVVMTTLLHTQANFLYRATVDTSANSGWEQLFPIVQQSGLGDLCEPSIPVPAAWVGKQGVIGVAMDGPDGILFQCSAVRFVNGTGTPPASCKNGTAKAAFVTDAKLAALVNATSSDYCNATNTTPVAPPKASGSGVPNATAAAPGLARGSFPLAGLVVATGLVCLGMLLL